MNRLKNFFGFTLIELLVMISIISILMGLILPALRKTLSKAKQISCMNNVRQIGIGVHLYLNDWSQFPFDYAYTEAGESPIYTYYERDPDGNRTYDWRYLQMPLLLPYVDNVSNIFRGPAAYKAYVDQFTDYGIPTYMVNNRSYVKYNSSTGLFDYAPVNLNDTHRDNYGDTFTATDTPLCWDAYWTGGGLYPPHDGHLVVLYMDGHYTPYLNTPEFDIMTQW